MKDQTQQEFLHAVKNDLGVTWDELAELAGIKPRALKTYRMPTTSNDCRTMSDLARNALIRALDDHQKKKN